MGKNAGWGQGVAEPLRNGNWVYASYLANGQKGPDDLATCRACHLPLASKDFVHRYDEHFAQKSSAAHCRSTITGTSCSASRTRSAPARASSRLA